MSLVLTLANARSAGGYLDFDACLAHYVNPCEHTCMGWDWCEMEMGIAENVEDPYGSLITSRGSTLKFGRHI